MRHMELWGLVIDLESEATRFTRTAAKCRSYCQQSMSATGRGRIRCGTKKEDKNIPMMRRSARSGI